MTGHRLPLTPEDAAIAGRTIVLRITRWTHQEQRQRRAAGRPIISTNTIGRLIERAFGDMIHTGRAMP